MRFINPIKNTDEIYSTIKEAYKEANIPTPYPAANKHLQSRLHQFVIKGLMDDQSVSNFDKVNSNRTYFLEKQNDIVQLMMELNEKDQPTKKLVVLPVDDEIKLIVTSFIQNFEESGFIESAPKCHKRLRDTYAVSDGRIRLVQRIIAKYVTSVSTDDNPGENEDDKQTGPIKTTRPIPNNENSLLISFVSGVTNRPKPNDENSPPISFVSGVTTRSKSTSNNKCKNDREQINNTKYEVKRKKKH